MSAGQDDPEGQAVGYGRPPKAGQFRKGQSGNPRGRPPKVAARTELVPARYPTREALRAEAARLIAVTDASGRQTISIREAVIRSLSLAAMRGGILAQRTMLQLASDEDARFHEERRESFKFWEDYQTNARAKIEAARKAGEAEVEFLPHPDDIELDVWSLEVRILGAHNEQGRATEKTAEALQDLGYEMMIYTDEDNCLPDKQGRGGQLGLYLALHLLGHFSLPPRLRRSGASYEKHLQAISAQGTKAWGDDLERRCSGAQVPFIRWPEKLKLPTIPLSKLRIK
ncbi:DUF5681 domain-containing protein [Humitalea sp. 24SJ18S-53]|uniref:DUF5681 domain-containing protein n=1 Tax=Humitalea sp. 24SJ18S-53 TaxID=3422307 RepID=UPI003D67F74A